MVVIEIQYFTSLCKIPLRSLRLLRDLRGYLPQPENPLASQGLQLHYLLGQRFPFQLYAAQF